MKLTENKLKKIVLNELQRYLTEDEAIDSKYLRDHLDYFIKSPRKPAALAAEWIEPLLRISKFCC